MADTVEHAIQTPNLEQPYAALGVKESRRVLELILDVRSRGIPIILISHNMPHVFEVADRIHIHRLGRRLCVIRPKNHSMSDAVAYMTGARVPDVEPTTIVWFERAEVAATIAVIPLAVHLTGLFDMIRGL